MSPFSSPFHEKLISQIPALQLLMNLGWQYLTPVEALALRGGSERNLVLEGILLPWLAAHNAVETRGQRLPFSEGNLREALRTLTSEPVEQGPILANKRVYELLTLGTSLTQTVDGDTKSYTLRYIDWEHPQRNVYHVTEEFPVQRAGRHDTRRPDIVLFVNGIPLVVIECKRPDKAAEGGRRAVYEAISQMLRNQHRDEIPHLFVYSQLLLAISTSDALYATTGTPEPFWTVWHEQTPEGRTDVLDNEIEHWTNVLMTEEQRARLYDWRDDGPQVRAHFDAIEAGGARMPTQQDRALWSLLRPARLLELAYTYIVFDEGVKKIARYQQYFAVKATVRRVAHLGRDGVRPGGVIWHTTGSGKSLTMVMLAKALALHPNIPNPRIVIVTDRIDLDAQIWGTFRACGKTVDRARSGRHLARMIEAGNVDIITTLIDKFPTVAGRRISDSDINTFVLVDESHRSQYGSSHARMRQVLPNACFIGFTGTPLLSAEKNTAHKFGGFIHTYSMQQAVGDKAVVPLLYEGRMAELAVNQEAIDNWFERVTVGLSDEQRLDLKRKFSQTDALDHAEQRIHQIAYDLSDHFVRNLQGTGRKAQLAVDSRATAMRYKEHLDEIGLISSAVVISPPDAREGYSEVDDSRLPALQAFWQRMMERYGSEEAYNREILASFHREDGIELLIVVDKLLVGFDEPRNTVLYIDKSLKEHGLLQAIARVNRLFEGKDFGYIIDYRGVLGELNEAMNTYEALAGFDAEDVAGTVTDVSAEIERLPQRHAELWDLFKTVPNPSDVEALQVFLGDEAVRQRFYDALGAYSRTLTVALGSVSFYERTPGGRIERYKADMAFFHNLRVAVKRRYAEVVDYGEYDQKVRKLLDSHIQSSKVSQITAPVNIFDVERFQAEVDKLVGDAAKADTIAHRVKATLTEVMERDPAFYRKFSRMIEDTIEAYRAGRISESEYLELTTDVLEQVRTGRDSSLPIRLRSYRDATAYFGVVHEVVKACADTDGGDVAELCADIAIRIEQIIAERKVRDWANNLDVQNAMKREIDDFLWDVREEQGLPLSDGDLDVIIGQAVSVAKHRSD